MSPPEPDNSSATDIRKPVAFQGASRGDLRALPKTAQRKMGQQLNRVQRGLDPNDWKPMPDVGAGVREIRVRDEAGVFRVIYVATRPEAIYVLHAFQKKTQATARRDIELAKARYRELPQSGR